MTHNDKYLRDRLYDMEAPYPGDMWDRIASNLPEKKENNKFWLFFLLFLLTAMIPASIYMSNHSNKEIANHNQIPIIEEHYTESNKPESAVLLNTSENDEDTPVSKSSISSPEVLTSFGKNNSTEAKPVSYAPSDEIKEGSTSFFEDGEDMAGIAATISDDFELTQEANRKHRMVDHPAALPLSIGNVESLDEYYTFDPPECPTFSLASSGGLYIDFVYSHDYGFKSLSARSQEFNRYVSERENTESPLYSFSAGVRISYVANSGFGLKTGLNYSQINEKFEYLDPDASLIRTIITIDTFLVGGVPTVVTDTSTIRIPGSLDITAYNRYKFFDIPILATYEAYLTDKIYYTINAGALINLTFSQKGRFLDPSGQPAWFTSSDPTAYDAYKTSAGISLYGSLGLHYYLSPQFDLILEPNFRLFAASLTRDDYPLNQKWLTGGLITGIRYKF